MMSISTRAKRRKTTGKLSSDDALAGGEEILATNNPTLTLEIVKAQFLLDIKRKNANLQKLSDEISNIYSTDNRSNAELWRDLRKLKANIDETLQEYKKRMVQNLMFESGPHVKDKSWCPERDSYVYDPHIRGKASFYDKCSCSNYRCPRQDDDGAIFPAFIQPTGEKALMIALGDTKSLEEWSLSEMKNYYLGAKVEGQINNLCYSFKSEHSALNRNHSALLAEDYEETQDAASSDEEEDAEDDVSEDAEADAVEEAENADTALAGNEDNDDEEDDEADVSDDENDDENDDSDEKEEETCAHNNDDGEALQTLLGSLSPESLSHHMTVYNLDLRQIIFSVYEFVGMMDTHFYAQSWEFFHKQRKEFMLELNIRSLKKLPRRGDIAFDPLQEMENLYLVEKLEGVLMLEIVAEVDKELFEEEFSEVFSQHIDD